MDFAFEYDVVLLAVVALVEHCLAGLFESIPHVHDDLEQVAAGEEAPLLYEELQFLYHWEEDLLHFPVIALVPSFPQQTYLVL